MSNHKILTPRKSLNKAFLKVKPYRESIENFKINMIQLIERADNEKREEHNKIVLIDFLKKTYYDPNHYINTKESSDLVVHNGKNADSSVGVIIETKKASNKAEMLSTKKLNTKALQELLLYYLRERVHQNNKELKHLIATNINEWFIFDAQLFEILFYNNKPLVNQFKEFEDGRLSGNTTDFFYKEIANPFIEKVLGQLNYTHFDLNEYKKPLLNNDEKDDNKLIVLFKLLSPEHLLKLRFKNDSNSLDSKFYKELLHIIGLTDEKQGGKRVIGRKKESERNAGTLLENTIIQLDSLDKIYRLEKPNQYGKTNQDRLFNVGLQLCITWINRILFLKLMEAQLINYHKGDDSYAFLNYKKIKNFDDLNSLFFQVLAKKNNDRSEEIQNSFQKVPYLNSSLFEPNDLEHNTLFISNLRDEKEIPLHPNTVLKNSNGKKRSGKLNTLEYLFAFLEAYDFSSEGAEEIQEDNKTLINASVLGLIFEKINGYKDGSFFTPGFITMYMCRESIRRSVIQKFNDSKSWDCKNFDELYDKIEDRNEANTIINSLKICDPAVGSGHFLVSALNEIIAVKNDLKILQDREGKRLKEYHFEVINDELVITDDDSELFEYSIKNKESQRVQEALFHEKQTIIENCLFGVDINPNSVKICRLRLWIELLKNAYYKSETELETLPNIDINIKCGNSLVSRFDLDVSISKILKNKKWNVDTYKAAVKSYQNAKTKEEKRDFERLIEIIKGDFRTDIAKYSDRDVRDLQKENEKLYVRYQSKQLFDSKLSKKQLKDKKELEENINSLTQKIKEKQNNPIFSNAFEWRFEFPEVLNDKGDYLGFDVVIGNPPYIRQEELKEFKNYFKSTFPTYSGTADIYVFFIEKGYSILKKNGEFTYIMPNKFMQAGYGRNARKFLLEHNIVEFLNFGDLQVFEEATTYPCILFAQKSNPNKDLKVINIDTLKFPDGFQVYIDTHRNVINQNSLNNETWIISNSEDQDLLEKIKSISKPLNEFLTGVANYGIKTGLSSAFFINEKTRNQIKEVDPNSIKLIKPMLRGRDITPWYSKSENSYLIGTFPSLRLNIDDFTGIKNHLKSFGIKRLEQSGENGSRKKTSGKWFETQDSIAYWKEFERPKIMYQRFQIKPCFIYDEEGQYCNDSVWIIPTDDKVLLGILNSKLGWWLISKYCTAIQNGYQLIWKYFSQVPIATANESQKIKITDKVNEIISEKKENPHLDLSELEAEIDQLVYQLYGLTDEEVKIVEGR
jgi:type II restriction/modification system DNA methylase subunit YeeA